MDVGRYVDFLEADGKLLARAAEEVGLAAQVPSCPGWRVGQLLRHVGYVHRWAAAHVAQSSPVLVEGPSEEEILQRGPADEELVAWFREGHAGLVEVLRTADPAVSCWTFLEAPSPLAFWARRQAHETAVHRADAELAGGRSTPFDPSFAADGIDELLAGFAPRERPVRAVTLRHVLEVCCVDTDDRWRVTLDPQAIRTHRVKAADGEGGYADSTVEGLASDLYLTLWNRTIEGARVSVGGDPGGLDLWQAVMQVGWS